MKTKTIWIWAVIFGFLATVTIYYLLLDKPALSQAPSVPADSPPPAIDPPKKEPLLQLNPKMRAISVPVTEMQGVSGYIREGDFVDIIITSPKGVAQTGEPPDFARLHLQKVKVLAVGHAPADPDAQKPTDYQTVTLEVVPAVGVTLALAVEHEYPLYLLLRPVDDLSTVPLISETVQGLNGGGSK